VPKVAYLLPVEQIAQIRAPFFKEITKPLAETIAFLMKEFDGIERNLVKSAGAFNYKDVTSVAREELIHTLASTVDKAIQQFIAVIWPLVVDFRSVQGHGKELDKVSWRLRSTL
jgi:hypothetical protein